MFSKLSVTAQAFRLYVVYGNKARSVVYVTYVLSNEVFKQQTTLT